MYFKYLFSVFDVPEFCNFKQDRLSQEFDFFSDKQQSSLFFTEAMATTETMEIDSEDAGAEKCLILEVSPKDPAVIPDTDPGS